MYACVVCICIYNVKLGRKSDVATDPEGFRHHGSVLNENREYFLFEDLSFFFFSWKSILNNCFSSMEYRARRSDR